MSRNSGDDKRGWLEQSDPMKELGATIRVLREGLQLSQEELAEKMGVSRGAVSAWETGTNTPRGKRLKKLGSVLGVTVPELMAGSAKIGRRTRGALVAVEPNGDETRVIDLRSAQVFLWSKSQQRVIVLEDKEGQRLAVLATDETIQALENCVLTLRELL
jgi:transcriptional regulator with XRE-family HTH domain